MNGLFHGARIISGTLVMLLVLAMAGAAPVAAHGSASSAATDAYYHASFGTTYLTAAHPAGSASGTTMLAARVQTTFNPSSGPQYTSAWMPVTPSGYWMSTNASRFANGHFWSGSGWYRSTMLAFTDNVAAPYHRTQWLIKWADGHQEYRGSLWVFC